MSTFEANHPTRSRKRSPRLWLIETLVVLGVLGFGYFAVTMDSSRWNSTTTTSAPTNLLTELAR